MAKCAHKTWGKYKGQTVGCKDGKAYIRGFDGIQAISKVYLSKSEIDSLIIALLQVRNNER